MKNKVSKWGLHILIFVCFLVFFLVISKPKDGWNEQNGNIRYILDGKPVTGWQLIEDRQFYFHEDGTLATGWQNILGQTYYLGTDGVRMSGWLTLENERYYLGADGAMCTGWQDLDGQRYYFNTDGTMTIGIMIEDGAAYLFDGQGRLSTGWIELDGSTYYGDEAGHPLFGWCEIDGRQHYFHESGAAASGWVTLDGYDYYFYTDGAPAQGRVVVDGQTHHFAANGRVLYLVNPWNYVPEGYEVELVPINATHKIAAVAYEDYLQMIADCEEAGFVPAVCSSYRTQEYQESLYEKRIKRYVDEGYSEEKATALAGRSVAIPGTSEHQLGLALDIVDDDNWHLDESQADMPTQQWLMKNSWRYGWILRYPVDKSEITGIIYEPWHYRYVGKAIAKEMYELDMCLEEYLQMLTNSVG